MDLISALKTLVPEMKEWRHHFHAHPEIAYEEHGTADYIAELLSSFGLTVHRGLAKTGVAGTLSKGKNTIKAIALRADIDGLSVTEETTVEYRSKNKGKMHACGHDGHMAMLLGAAKYLASNESFEGTVHFIFQPAEENEGGAKTMIDDGLFSRFPVEGIYGMHNFPNLPEGHFALCPGPMMASYDVFDIIIKGTGTHAATPHLGTDTILAAARMITMFQEIISRNINPAEPGVLSVTQIHGGTTYNILPQSVSLQGTVRAFSEETRDLIRDRIGEIARGITAASNMELEFSYEKRYPVLVNSPEETENALNAARRAAGADKVSPTITPFMGAEDFAFMLHKVPGAYIALGAGSAGKNETLHNPGYNFNDNILSTGAAYWVALAELLLPHRSETK
ncbi:MAG: amidohydrolase [bacterium]|nr:amidohydrolase [bacterium]